MEVDCSVCSNGRLNMRNKNSQVREAIEPAFTHFGLIKTLPKFGSRKNNFTLLMSRIIF